MKKLHRLFDRFYVWVESTVNAAKDYPSDRRNARALGRDARVTEQYRSVIRPYWKQFKVAVPRRFWFDLYANSHKPFSPKYIPNDLWFARILPFYSDTILAKAWQDKCAYHLLFPDMRRPETVVKRMGGVFCSDALEPMDEAQAVACCRGVGRVIVKPSVGSGGGLGILFCDIGSMSEQEIRGIFARFGKNFIIQKKLDQHPDLARLNPSSLNTLRIITFLHDGQAQALTSVLRIGGAGSELDNLSRGGYQCNVGPDGRVFGEAMSHASGRWEYFSVHPDSGIRFSDVVIPGYDRVLAAVTAHAARMPHFRIIGWDIAVDPDAEPVLIEFNALPGLNQETDGPNFGDLTDQVLEEVFGRRGTP